MLIKLLKMRLILVTEFSYRPNDPIAVVWPINGELKSYIALFVNKNSNGTLLIDNLEPDCSNKYWKRSIVDDLQDIPQDQVVSFNVLGD